MGMAKDDDDDDEKVPSERETATKTLLSPDIFAQLKQKLFGVRKMLRGISRKHGKREQS